MLLHPSCFCICAQGGLLGNSGAYSRTNAGAWLRAQSNPNAGFYKISSLPPSKAPGFSFGMAMKDGAMAVNFTGTATMSEALTALGIIGVSLTGSSILFADGNELHNISVDYDGAGNLSFNNEIDGITQLGVNFKVSELSQGDITGAVLDTPIEGTYTLRQLMKLISAVQMGKSTIADLGGGNATVTFRDINDTEDRIVATMSDSDRTDVVKTD